MFVIVKIVDTLINSKLGYHMQIKKQTNKTANTLNTNTKSGEEKNF